MASHSCRCVRDARTDGRSQCGRRHISRPSRPSTHIHPYFRTFRRLSDSSLPQWPQFTWSPFAFCGPQLSAMPGCPPRTVGFLGFGRIAQAVLARLVPFNVTDFLYSSNPTSPPDDVRDAALVERHKLRKLKRVDVDQLAQCSDVVFVLAPGGEATRHLIDESFLKRMKRSSILVNASRGTLVDSDALALALREGWIWGAGLDVVEGEPEITADHPLVKEPRCVGVAAGRSLTRLYIPPNRCVIVPHIGSATLETRVAMATLAVQNVLAGISNEPLVASVDLGGGRMPSSKPIQTDCIRGCSRCIC